MSVRNSRLVLRPAQLGDDVARIAQLRDWRFLGHGLEEGPIPARCAWEIDGEHLFGYKESTFFRLRYVLVTGPDHARIAGEIRRSIDAYAPEELLEAWDAAEQAAQGATRDDIDRRIAAACALGIGAPAEMDERFLDRLLRALRDEQPAVRFHAVYSAAYVGWHQFEGVLREMADADPYDEVRKIASTMARAYEALRKGANQPGPGLSH